MNKFSLIAGVALLALDLGQASAANKDSRLSFVNTPLSFEPNVGQSESKAQFLARGAGYRIHLSPGQARFEFPRAGKGEKSRSVTMDLINANKKSPIKGESSLPGQANYFPGPDKSQWRSHIPTYSRVSERDVYPGIDVAFYGNQKRLEYDFIVGPNADPNAIQLALAGSDSSVISESGDVRLSVGGQSVALLKPIAYQIAADGHTRESVEASYRMSKTGETLTFSLGKYDQRRPLVIDPVLAYSEYLDTYASAVAVDSSGNTYVASSYIYSGSGFHVIKFNSSGSIVYDANIGSGSGPVVNAIAVNSSGQVYAVGTTYSTTLPTGSNSYQASASYIYSAFLVTVSADGSSVPYATYLNAADSSSASTSTGRGLAIDSNGNAYISGVTYPSAFPTTTGAFQTSRGSAYSAGFLTKISPSNSGAASLIYSTYLTALSGNEDNIANAVAVDSSGNAYVTGRVHDTTFPFTSGAFQYSGYHRNDGGAYIAKLNSTGTTLIYGAYIGYGTGNGIAVDASGDAYVTGTVDYGDFPLLPMLIRQPIREVLWWS